MHFTRYFFTFDCNPSIQKPSVGAQWSDDEDVRTYFIFVVKFRFQWDSYLAKIVTETIVSFFMLRFLISRENIYFEEKINPFD